MLDERKRAGALFGLRGPASLRSVSLKNFERGQVARAQAQAFQIQKLHEGDNAQQGDAAGAASATRQLMRRARSIRPPGRPSRARQRVSARAMRPPIGLVIHAQQVQQRRAASGSDFIVRWYARSGAPARARGPSEIAISPKGQTLFSGSRWAGGRERQHVGGVILAAKFTVQAAQLGVAGNQAIECAGPRATSRSSDAREALDSRMVASSAARAGM